MIEASLASRRTLKSQLMPSIQARSYPVSAMVPSALPVQPAANTSKTTAQKTDAVAPSGSSTSVSNRVSAFLASDTATEKSSNRPDRPPPPPGGGKGPEGAGGSGASSETETALLLLETEEDTETDETTDTALTTAILSGDTDASAATSEADTALLLLEADTVDDAENEQLDEETETQPAAVLFDEAKTYYPTAFY